MKAKNQHADAVYSEKQKEFVSSKNRQIIKKKQ